jgi:hypothetical protein
MVGGLLALLLLFTCGIFILGMGVGSWASGDCSDAQPIPELDFDFNSEACRLHWAGDYMTGFVDGLNACRNPDAGVKR